MGCLKSSAEVRKFFKLQQGCCRVTRWCGGELGDAKVLDCACVDVCWISSYAGLVYLAMVYRVYKGLDAEQKETNH